MPPKNKKRKTSEQAGETETETVNAKGDGEPEVKKEPGKLEDFTKYYKENELCPENEWNQFMKSNTTLPPTTFRFMESFRLAPSHMDTVPGLPSQATVLVEYMKKKYLEQVNKMTLGSNMPVKLESLPWYPDELGWSLNIPQSELDKYLGIKEWMNFFISEKNVNSIQRLETWSMFPITLVDIQPYHKVLDMCAAPGFIAGQVSELMHSDPSLAHEGVLVLNDLYKMANQMAYRWTQGTKCVFTNNDAKTYPELYTTEQKTPESQIRYDRVICDVKCSCDGSMRKNTGIQEQWSYRSGLNMHKEQKQILKRALELTQFGGQVLYTTTSYNPVENEAVVMAVMKECEGSVVLLDSRRTVKNMKIRPGMNTWKVMTGEGFFWEKYNDATDEFRESYPESVFPPALKEAKAFHMERCVRVLPHDNDTAGFFCAVLVKNSELPWVKARKQTEMKAKLSGLVPDANAPKQYGYRLKLKCKVALMELEWTKEVTDEKLVTKTTTEVEKFAAPEVELDPSCKPHKLVDIDTFKFCESDNEQWLKIKEFFKISDDFDPTCMLAKNLRNEFYLTTPLVKTIITCNKESDDVKFGGHVGVLLFQRMGKMWITMPPKMTCNSMMSNMGFAALFPYIGRQVINITREDLLMLAHNEKVKIDQLSEKAQADVKESEQGCVLFLYRPEDIVSVPNCNLTFVGARGETYITDYKEGLTIEKKTTFRLCGMEHEDYTRKIAEEKLAKVMEKEQAAKDAAPEKMETSA